jgi:hypothetical protein
MGGEISKIGDLRNAYVVGHSERKGIRGKYMLDLGVIFKWVVEGD